MNPSTDFVVYRDDKNKIFSGGYKIPDNPNLFIPAGLLLRRGGVVDDEEIKIQNITNNDDCPDNLYEKLLKLSRKSPQKGGSVQLLKKVEQKGGSVQLLKKVEQKGGSGDLVPRVETKKSFKVEKKQTRKNINRSSRRKTRKSTKLLVKPFSKR